MGVRSSMKKYFFLLCIGLSFFSRVFADPLPLGTIVSSTANVTCPAGFTCKAYKAQCPGISDGTFWVAYEAQLSATPTAMLVVFPGGGGSDWWSNENSDAMYVIDELRQVGFTIAQVQWKASWGGAATGVESGAAATACRPSTAIRYIYDNYYVPLNIHPAEIGQCGFCLSGNSGGTNQDTYPLAYYGLDNIVAATIPTGGPTYSTLYKSCLRHADESSYWYNGTTRNGIDNTYGKSNNNGPCFLMDEAHRDIFYRDSVAAGGNDYYYPTTRVVDMVGEKDLDQVVIAHDYYARVLAEGSPYVQWQIIPGTGHRILASQAGRDMWKTAVLASTGVPNPDGGGDPPPPPPPPPPPDPGNGPGVVSPSNYIEKNCAAGYTCTPFNVTCPNVANQATFVLAVKPPSGTSRGVLAILPGAQGQTWVWTAAPYMMPAVDQLTSAGMTIATIRWITPVFDGENGIAVTACRPATAVRWIYDKVYKPLGITPTHVGECGFCVTGNSGGSDETGYPLEFYGQDTFTNAIIPTGGPTRSAVDKACLGPDRYLLDGTYRNAFDRSYGFPGDSTGPCFLKDPTWSSTWYNDAVAGGGPNYNHPTTRVHIIIGGKDSKQLNVAKLYYDRLIAAGSPYVTWEVAAGTPHETLSTDAGRAAWVNAVLSYVP